MWPQRLFYSHTVAPHERFLGHPCDLFRFSLSPSLRNSEIIMSGSRLLSADECRKKLTPFVLEKIEFDSSEELGKGAYGAVFEVTVNGVPCIAKRVHEVLVDRLNVSRRDRKGITEQFLRECVRLSELKHPNIVHFIGVHYRHGPDDVSLVMERLNTDVGKFVENTPNLPLSIKVSILCDVSYGLVYLHDKNILHRDLTANNIILTMDLQAKIADLGVSKMITIQHQVKLAQTKAPGSQYYMPPEALKENPKYSQKLDIFSFGHLSIYVAIQEFPNVYEVTITPAVLAQGIHQRLRRRKALDKVGEDHCLYALITSCLSDYPEKRPSTNEVNVRMKKLCLQNPRSMQNELMQNELMASMETLTKERDEAREEKVKRASEYEQDRAKLLKANQLLKEEQQTVHEELQRETQEVERLQKVRMREDEFEANTKLRAKCEELQKWLGFALDDLDGLRQQQDVLKQTLQDNGLQLPFLETEQTGHGGVPVESTQGKGKRSNSFPRAHVPVVPPHSAATQQASAQGKEKAVVGILPSAMKRQVIPRDHPVEPSPNAMYQRPEEYIVSIFPSAMKRQIIPRSPIVKQPQGPAPMVSRHSAGDVQAGNFPRDHPVEPSPNAMYQMPANQMQLQSNEAAQFAPPQDPYYQPQPSDQHYRGQHPFSASWHRQYGQHVQASGTPVRPELQGHPQPPLPQGYQHPVQVSPNLLPNLDDGELLMKHLSEDILDTVAEVNESDHVGDGGKVVSGLQSLPPDPNLQCVACGKYFKIGQIQLYKRHVATCTGPGQ